MPLLESLFALTVVLALASLLIPKPEADLGEEEVKESKD